MHSFKRTSYEIMRLPGGRADRSNPRVAGRGGCGEISLACGEKPRINFL